MNYSLFKQGCSIVQRAEVETPYCDPRLKGSIPNHHRRCLRAVGRASGSHSRHLDA